MVIVLPFVPNLARFLGEPSKVVCEKTKFSKKNNGNYTGCFENTIVKD
jgi:hypothetical protein